MIRNDAVTNNAVPGLLAPTGAGLLTAGAVSDAWLGTRAATAGRWAFSGFRGIEVGSATFTSLESGVLVAGTSALNFAMTGVAFEGGVLAGSMVSAIPTGSGNTVSDLLTNWLFNEFGPDTSNIPELACGW